MNLNKLLTRTILVVSVLTLLTGCGTSARLPSPAPPTALATLAPATPRPTASPSLTPTATRRSDGLSADEAATLGSLEQVDDYPLYTMRYHGAYNRRLSSAEDGRGGAGVTPPAWACSLFAALGDADDMLYGRNFDWEFSPAVMLFTDPPDGYASVSLVDVAYLGFGGANARALTDLPLAERRALLDAPFLPFDGMNEHGLAIGMAAVPPGGMPPDPAKETVGSLLVIRKMLDGARDVDEALAILESYNVDMSGGPPVHYLLADRSGRALLVEFYQGERVVLPNEVPWHQATNFLRASAGASAQGRCWRYDEIDRRLTETGGQLAPQDALDLLAGVSQNSTQWSVVYGMSSGQVSVAMGQQYDQVHTLSLAGE